VQEMMYIETLMDQQTKTLTRIMPEHGVYPPIEWTDTWKLPRQYHPDNFIASLEDTPDQYQYPEIDKVTIPVPLARFLQKPQDIHKGFSRESLVRLKAEEKRQMFIADIIDSRENVLITRSKDREGESHHDFGTGELLRRFYDSVSPFLHMAQSDDNKIRLACRSRCETSDHVSDDDIVLSICDHPKSFIRTRSLDTYLKLLLVDGFFAPSFSC
jgi:hypothetical protein